MIDRQEISKTIKAMADSYLTVFDGKLATVEDLKKWLGLSYEGNIYYAGNHCPAQVLRNAVHPEIGRQVFSAAMS